MNKSRKITNDSIERKRRKFSSDLQKEFDVRAEERRIILKARPPAETPSLVEIPSVVPIPHVVQQKPPKRKAFTSAIENIKVKRPRLEDILINIPHHQALKVLSRIRMNQLRRLISSMKIS